MGKLTNEDIADLTRLQEKLRLQERDMLLTAARGGMLPPRRVIQEIAEIETVILALGEVLAEGGH